MHFNCTANSNEALPIQFCGKYRQMHLCGEDMRCDGLCGGTVDLHTNMNDLCIAKGHQCRQSELVCKCSSLWWALVHSIFFPFWDGIKRDNFVSRCSFMGDVSASFGVGVNFVNVSLGSVNTPTVAWVAPMRCRNAFCDRLSIKNRPLTFDA